MALRTLPPWVLGVLPLALIATAIAVFAALGGPGLAERKGPPVEELAVERTVLEPGLIELRLRNDGPDEVRLAQVVVNDAYVAFGGEERIGRLAGSTVKIRYPWIEGEAYEVLLVTSTGATISHAIDVAVETPDGNVSFFALMALLGIYVGVIPIALGMLWLPWVRRVSANGLRFLMALTVGLLGFLAVDAALEGLDLGAQGPQAFGGTGLVILGAAFAYLGLMAVDAHLRERRERARDAGASGAQLALLIAVGIGLHNLGEGLAIGSAYATGALALGAFLVIGFAIHNTTEGLAIVAALGREQPPVRRLVVLGLIAGAPAVLGAWIGASAFHPSLAAFLFGLGVGAIVQVIQQLAPTLRDAAGRAIQPLTFGGIVAGAVLMYATGLLVSV
jgi:ZIP family zinc transporter